LSLKPQEFAVLREKSVATGIHISRRSIPLDMAVVTNVAVLSYFPR